MSVFSQAPCNLYNSGVISSGAGTGACNGLVIFASKPSFLRKQESIQTHTAASETRLAVSESAPCFDLSGHFPLVFLDWIPACAGKTRLGCTSDCKSAFSSGGQECPPSFRRHGTTGCTSGLNPPTYTGGRDQRRIIIHLPRRAVFANESITIVCTIFARQAARNRVRKAEVQLAPDGLPLEIST